MSNQKARVVKPNFLDLRPGGWYDMAEGCQVETRVAKLHLLVQHVESMIVDLCETSENRLKFAPDVERLADSLYKLYEPGIKLGIDVFSTADHQFIAIDPLANKLQYVMSELKEALDCCENVIEASYIGALIQLLTMVDVQEYKKLHAKLDDYEKDYGRTLYWKKATQL